jgi:hypothetical protein
MDNSIRKDFNPSNIDIENRIFTLRGMQVMIDSHLAEMYGVEIKVLNQAVKRNNDRFPDNFMFQLNELEWDFLRSQIVTLKNPIQVINPQSTTVIENRGKHRKYLPHVFTEQGVAMLSAVLKSKTAVVVSVRIINTFVEMRKILINNALVIQRLDKIELKLLETDQKFEHIFKALESKNSEPEKGVFYDGQIFDAYTFIADIIRKAEKSIILIDNFIDDTVLTQFTKRNAGVKVSIYTKTISKQLQLDIQKHNAQYPKIEIHELNTAHDRFLIIDQNQVYHIGASLKDLGKKWFAFSKMDTEVQKMLNLLNITIL